MLKVYLKDGARLRVDATLDAFESAIREAVLIRVKTADGRIIAVSPSNVSLVETIDDNGASPSVRPLTPSPTPTPSR